MTGQNLKAKIGQQGFPYTWWARWGGGK